MTENNPMIELGKCKLPAAEMYDRELTERFILQRDQCARACSGLDMTNVPEGAVKRLVEAAENWLGAYELLKGIEYNEYDDCEVETRQALAPFLDAMKEQAE